MKRMLATLGALTLSVTSGVSVISCNGTSKMTSYEVENVIYKVASEKVLSYEGPFLFNLSDSGPGRKVFLNYIWDSLLYNFSGNPSSLTKLVTKTFMQELRKESPMIFKNYPDFTLECVIEKVPTFSKDNMKSLWIDYSVYYNLHALDKINQLTNRAGDIIDQSNPMNHVNLDNFVGTLGAERLTEGILHDAHSKTFSFNLIQTSYLDNTHDRLNFINNLYVPDTRPIKLTPSQNYEALNMFNIFTCDFHNDNFSDPEFIKLVKEITIARIKEVLLKYSGFNYKNWGTLGDLKVIDDVNITLKNMQYFSNQEVLDSPFWSKILCTKLNPNVAGKLTEYPFLNGIMTFDLELFLESEGIESESSYKERIFINFI